jgi:hypothetical protein
MVVAAQLCKGLDRLLRHRTVRRRSLSVPNETNDLFLRTAVQKDSVPRLFEIMVSMLQKEKKKKDAERTVESLPALQGSQLFSVEKGALMGENDIENLLENLHIDGHSLAGTQVSQTFWLRMRIVLVQRRVDLRL